MRTVWRENGESRSVTAPLSLIVSAFAPVTDARKAVTPEAPPGCELLLIDLGRGKHRLGTKLAVAGNLVIAGAGFLGGHLALYRGTARRTLHQSPLTGRLDALRLGVGRREGRAPRSVDAGIERGDRRRRAPQRDGRQQ